MKIIFTNHAKHRIKRREFLREEVVHIIKYPDKIIKKHGLYYYQKRLEKGKVEVVCEKTEMKIFLNLNQRLRKREKNLKIITIYWV